MACLENEKSWWESFTTDFWWVKFESYDFLFRESFELFKFVKIHKIYFPNKLDIIKIHLFKEPNKFWIQKTFNSVTKLTNFLDKWQNVSPLVLDPM